MPISMRLRQLFPDDENDLPRPGTSEQSELIADEEQIANEGYLDTIRSFDPQAERLYDEIATHALSALDVVGKRRDLRVLDLASGIALEILALLKGDITVQELTLTDYSATTLDTAQRLVLGSPDANKIAKVNLLPFDLLAESLKDKVATSYDLALSCNSFMHFSKQDHARIFRDVFNILKDRGVFIFESHFRVLNKDWKQFIIQETKARMANRGISVEFINQVGEHYSRFHHYHPVFEVYNWFEDAGFGYFDCVYKNGIIGIFLGIK